MSFSYFLVNFSVISLTVVRATVFFNASECVTVSTVLSSSSSSYSNLYWRDESTVNGALVLRVSDGEERRKDELDADVSLAANVDIGMRFWGPRLSELPRLLIFWPLILELLAVLILELLLKECPGFGSWRGFVCTLCSSWKWAYYVSLSILCKYWVIAELVLS